MAGTSLVYLFAKWDEQIRGRFPFYIVLYIFQGNFFQGTVWRGRQANGRFPFIIMPPEFAGPGCKSFIKGMDPINLILLSGGAPKEGEALFLFNWCPILFFPPCSFLRNSYLPAGALAPKGAYRI
jgi:hypothetical protein